MRKQGKIHRVRGGSRREKKPRNQYSAAFKFPVALAAAKAKPDRSYSIPTGRAVTARVLLEKWEAAGVCISMDDGRGRVFDNILVAR